MVNRFEAVVSEEIRDHELSLKRYKSEIDSLNERLDSFEILIRKKFLDSDNSYKKYIEKLDNMEKDIKMSFSVHQRTIINIKNDILKMMNRFYCDFEKLSTKNDLEDLKKSMSDQVQDFEKRTYNDIQNKAFQINDFHVSAKKDHEELKNCLSDLQDKQEKELSFLKNKSTASSLEQKCFLHELQMHKKKEFINEKKIEALFTLVEKLKNKDAN